MLSPFLHLFSNCLHCTPQKSNMTMKSQPFEDVYPTKVSPIKNRDFPLPC